MSLSALEHGLESLVADPLPAETVAAALAVVVNAGADEQILSMLGFRGGLTVE